jgi:hypothetical protein
MEKVLRSLIFEFRGSTDASPSGSQDGSPDDGSNGSSKGSLLGSKRKRKLQDLTTTPVTNMDQLRTYYMQAFLQPDPIQVLRKSASSAVDAIECSSCSQIETMSPYEIYFENKWYTFPPETNSFVAPLHHPSANSQPLVSSVTNFLITQIQKEKEMLNKLEDALHSVEESWQEQPVVKKPVHETGK